MKNIIGKIFQSKNYGKFKVLEKTSRRKYYKCIFINTDYVGEFRKDAIVSGEIKDKLYPSVYNIGCMGYATEKNNNKEYRLWGDMLKRCYNNKSEYYSCYGGRGVKVCDRWHRFDYFLEDIQLMPNWSKEKFYNEEISLDKDIKGKKTYSKEGCIWISRNQNFRYQPSQQNYFKATSPTGKVYYHFNITDFARNFDKLKRRNISAVLHNRANTHWGWKFEYIDKLPEDLTPLNIDKQFTKPNTTN